MYFRMSQNKEKEKRNREKLTGIGKGRIYPVHMSAVLLFLLLTVFLNAAAEVAYSSALQQGIAGEVVRFHILANSDSEEDQNVKYLVRDAVLSWMTENIQETQQEEQRQEMLLKAPLSVSLETIAVEKDSSRAITLAFLSENLSQVKIIADEVLQEANMPYQATAELTKSYFPERTYGDCTFPAGWYEALRIQLGEARGQNWWCLLYPGLCFSDCLHAVMDEEGRASLREILTVEEYESLLQSPGQWKIAFKWFGRGS